jgi:diphthamide biosynthesis protein 2
MTRWNSDILYRTYRLPVIYVFGKKPIDVADVAQKLFDSFASPGVSAKSVVLRHDVAYTHETGASERLLFQRFVKAL